MVLKRPDPVSQKRISSDSITGFTGGLYMLDDASAPPNSFTSSHNIQLTTDHLITPRDNLASWLPATENTIYQVYPALYNGAIVYYVMDGNHVVWATESSTAWTPCGGSNTYTGNSNDGIVATFLQVNNTLLVMNGVDKLSYVDLATKDVTQYSPVADPTTAPTTALAGLTTGSYNIYYAYSYNSTVGETLISPIKTQSINITRDQWVSTTHSITVTRPAAPVGAKTWNVYLSLAPSGTSIESSDMLRVASGLDISSTTFVDNGLLPIDLAIGVAPTENSTSGPRVSNGLEDNGRPILYGDVDNPYNIWIGGDGEHSLDFSANNGGYRLEIARGTGFYPSGVIGFRNGQGIPSIMVVSSSTVGSSKTFIIEQSTVNIGDYTFVVWGALEQNSGSAGTTASYGVIKYQGSLYYPSYDGWIKVGTQASVQNILSSDNKSKTIRPAVDRLNSDSFKNIVGTAWNEKLIWAVSADGASSNNQIWVNDLANNGAWYFWNIIANWVGVISPKSEPAFMYIANGNQLYRFVDSVYTADYNNGDVKKFSTSVMGAQNGFNEGKNSYAYLITYQFELTGLTGTINIGVLYRNRFNKLKNKQKTISISENKVMSVSGGWSDGHLSWGGQLKGSPSTWSGWPTINLSGDRLNTDSVIIKLPIRDIARVSQWYLNSYDDGTDYSLRSISRVFITDGLGVKVGIR